MIKPLSESLDRSARKLALRQSSPAEQQVFGAEFLDLVLALCAPHPMLFLWASSGLPQSCPKNGDTARSVSATSLQLSESLRPNISDVRRSTANTPCGCAVLGYLGKWRRCSIE